MNGAKSFMSIFISFILLLGLLSVGAGEFSSFSYAADNNDIGKLLRNCDFTYSKVSFDVEYIEKDLGFDISNIESIEEVNGKPNYLLNVGNVDSTIQVSRDRDKTKYLISEGTIKNELVFYDSGDIYLDGSLVEYENSVGTDVPRKVEGVTYSKNAPKEVSSWRPYRLNWVCSSIELHKYISDVAVSAILALLFKSKAASAASIFAGPLISRIQTNDPYSTGISYKIWVSNSKVPATSRYTRLKKRIYAKTRYNGFNCYVTYYARKG